MIETIYTDKIEFSSITQNISVAEKLLMKLKNTLKIDEEKYYNILIAVTEAANNAIIHGNKRNENKKVLINAIATREQIEISIKDEGEGFNPKDVADPRNPENLLKDHGRGIFLIRSLSDSNKIESSKSGSTITMFFNYK